jgi:uncharacterized protein (TIGR00645 family)
VDFSGLKIKVIASIVAISAIELLKAFVNVGAQISAAATDLTTPWVWSAADTALAWKVGIHFILVFSGVLFAYMDKVAEESHSVKHSRH